MILNYDADSPLVSVVIPSYNHGEFLAEAISSVVNQSYPNWEILIVDNNSTDSTDDVLSKFVDPRIKVIKVVNNGSIAFSRNMGVSSSTGEWIAFLDADDCWDTDKLLICSKYFKSEVTMIHHKMERFETAKFKQSGHSSHSVRIKKTQFVKLLVQGNSITNSSVVIRHSDLLKIGKFDESSEMIAVEDYNMWLRITRIFPGVISLSENLGGVRRHGRNISQEFLIDPPWPAIRDFLPELSKSKYRKLVFSYRYSKVRRKYLEELHVCQYSDFIQIIVGGKMIHKVKSVWMLSVFIYWRIRA